MGWPLTSDDVKKALGITGALSTSAQASYDTAELQLYADAAMEAVEGIIGPHRGQRITVQVAGPASVVLLPQRAADVISVTVSGQPAPFTHDQPAGIITGTFGSGTIDVVAIAPDANPPARVILAARDIAALWWRQDKQGPRTAGMPGAEPATPQGFAIPRKVNEMLDTLRGLAGFA